MPLAGLDQKRFYANTYDSTTGEFNTAVSYGSPTHVANGQYRVTAAAASFAPEQLATAPAGTTGVQAYVYVGDGVLATEAMTLYDDVTNVGLDVAGDVDGAYVSAANVAGCEKCHGAPYMKHGYRAAAVAGMADFAACKACHLDQTAGGHQGWQLLVDDKAAYAAQNGVLTDAQKAKYAYKRSVMNDTHMSHAMEFAYPQSMANCVTCHEGKLGAILSNANFTLATCKSCHPVRGVGGTNDKRAPALEAIMPASFHSMVANDGLYTYTGACNGCHSGASAIPTFAQIHTGYNTKIFASEGVKHSSAITTSIDTVSFDATTKKLTVNFSVAGAEATAVFKPTVVVSLYGYDTKDFIVSGHGSTGGFRNLEAAFGADNARMQIAQGATSNAFIATADLTLWAAKIGDSVKRAEIGVLPALGVDRTKTPDNNAQIEDPPDSDIFVPNPNYNPYIAIRGVTRTFDLARNALVADANVYGKDIVDPNKCNACHEALGTTFHNPAYGSAGVVGCRLCHVGLSGGSHLEVQSRSIDSYVHAIHSFQAFDPGDVNFADAVEKLEYDHHVASTYPNFTTMNCESCHNPGKYEVPDQGKSLPGLLSGTDALPAGWADRNVTGLVTTVTGPGSRACGSCHRARMIKADNAGGLEMINEHTSKFGYLVTSTTGLLDAAIEKLMAIFN